MNTWLQFLKENGAQLQLEGVPQVTGFSTHAASAGSFVSPLLEYGLISVTGEDAASFLHNQLTNDIEHLGAGEARLAGYCSPKGRLLASLLVWQSAEGFMLMLSRDIQPAVQKRLQMFVLRAKVKLLDVTEQFAILGVSGETAATVAQGNFHPFPAAPYAKVNSVDTSETLIRVADAFGAPRHLWITPFDAASQVWAKLVASTAPSGSNAWKLAEIHAGIPLITQATQEQFVPQMVNFDAIGGISFKKGCYPGQEIVARTHYLGKVKRRMVLATTEAEAKTGAEVFSSIEPEQPCGMVVNTALNPDGGTDCLVEIKTALANQGSVHVGSIAAPELRFLPLPYNVQNGE